MNLIEKAELDLRQWLAAHPDYTLPDSPWALPSDCPLWSAGLSMAQASGVLAVVRSGAAA